MKAYALKSPESLSCDLQDTLCFDEHYIAVFKHWRYVCHEFDYMSGMSGDTGTPKASTPSWDTGPSFQPAQPAQKQTSAQPSLDFPRSQIHSQSSSTRPPSQSTRYAAGNGQSVAQPSWQGSPTGAGAGSGGSASDPFANMSAPIAQTSSASTGHQGTDMMSGSLFSGLSTGRPYPIALLMICHRQSTSCWTASARDLDVP